MTIFAAITPDDDAGLEQALAVHFPGKFYKIAPGQFLISAQMTTEFLSEEIGAKAGKVGKIILIRVFNYTGWHSKDMWEWLAEESKEQAQPPSPLYDHPRNDPPRLGMPPASSKAGDEQ